MSKPAPNIAVQRLRSWLESNNKSQSDAARILGVSRGRFSNWMVGTAVPDRQSIAAIKAMTGGLITFDDWLSDAEVLAARKARATI